MAAELRMEEVISLNKQMLPPTSSSNKKRKLSVDPAPAPALTEDEAEAPAKRLKLDVEFYEFAKQRLHALETNRWGQAEQA